MSDSRNGCAMEHPALSTISSIIRSVLSRSNFHRYPSANATMDALDTLGVLSLPRCSFSRRRRFSSASTSAAAGFLYAASTAVLMRIRSNSANLRKRAPSRNDTAMDAALMSYVSSRESNALTGRYVSVSAKATMAPSKYVRICRIDAAP